jgi:hypothetical protein
MNPDPPSQMHESLVENFLPLFKAVWYLEDDFKHLKALLFSATFAKKEEKELAKKTVNIED